MQNLGEITFRFMYETFFTNGIANSLQRESNRRNINEQIELNSGWSRQKRNMEFHLIDEDSLSQTELQIPHSAKS